ncbi:uncharacterized protein MKK02DRAFT_38464 [Dioszegia hungarica]|uniref:Uncharacterized protein n=1 Tax=Dioszegia hungarica TaxID=4972 RepID=A0AA38H6H0_9TREE|nr:uncharacterized protein MKK02DRAFT_38464 [Dioszegia hungarica]KAI9633806.1 hypothetical protein MKK02DRAFT_38464 [Dioszegia hungarica]
MPPRRTGRRSRVDAAEPAEPRSAAREFYLVPELRERLLANLDQDSLAQFMRVEKKCSFDARQRVSCAAVQAIDATGMNLVQSFQRQLGLEELFAGEGKKDRLEEYLGRYNPELTRLVIPPLRKKFPNLQGVHFGTYYTQLGAPVWRINFNRPVPSANPPPRGVPTTYKDGLDLGGNLFIVHCYIPKLSDFPYSVGAEPLEAPWRHFGGDLFFDVQFQSADPELGPGTLYEAIDLAELPVLMEDLTRLYQRQIDYGSPYRLKSIQAMFCSPCRLEDFQLFAHVASHSLVQLQLAGGFRDDVLLSFKDLPVMIETITTLPPQLEQLWIALKGIDTAEEDCKGLLNAQTLRDGGTLKILYIFTDTIPGPLWNLIRAVSPMCAANAQVDISDRYGIRADQQNKDAWSEETQSAYLQCLRSQPEHARAHLATADFPSLGFDTPDKLPGLQVGADGKPLSRFFSKAEDWLDKSEKRAELLNGTILPNIDLGMRQYAEACEAFARTAVTDTPAERLAQMKIMLATLDQVETAERQLFSISEEQDTTEAQVKQYIRELKGEPEPSTSRRWGS